jgi:hypothetical protein
MKECTKCHEAKEYSEFYQKKQGGHYSQCKQCHCKYVKDQYWCDSEKREEKKMYQKISSRLYRRIPK